MRVQDTIERKIAQSLTPAHLEVINESHMHNVPPGSESHFKVIVVADAFDGVNRSAASSGSTASWKRNCAKTFTRYRCRR